MCCYKGYTCLCWFAASIAVFMLAICFFAGIHIGFGGPVPTSSIASGVRNLYVGCAIGIIGCISASVVILKFIDIIASKSFVIRVVVLAVVDCVLAYTVFSNVYSVAAISTKITAKDIVEYSKEYAKVNHAMPPLIVKAQQEIGPHLVWDGVPLGCCGYQDFNDYLLLKPDNSQELKKCEPPGALVKFTAEITCSKDEKFKSKNDFKDQEYLSYDSQLYVHRLFIQKAHVARNMNELKKFSKDAGKNFSDWISSGKSDIGEDELPESDGNINYKPKLDCNRFVKSRFKEHLGDWDNKTAWNKDNFTSDEIDDFKEHQDYPPSKIFAGDRYILSVDKQVKTAVLGCGEFIELIFSDNRFVDIVLEETNMTFIKTGMKTFRMVMIVIATMAFIFSIANLVWFNYYYIPIAIIAGKCSSLPFTPDRPTAIVEVIKKPSKVEPESSEKALPELDTSNDVELEVPQSSPQ